MANPSAFRVTGNRKEFQASKHTFVLVHTYHTSAQELGGQGLQIGGYIRRPGAKIPRAGEEA